MADGDELDTIYADSPMVNCAFSSAVRICDSILPIS